MIKKTDRFMLHHQKGMVLVIIKHSKVVKQSFACVPAVSMDNSGSWIATQGRLY